MRWVVFLRAVNVGGTNRCRPAAIAKKLSKFGVINLGAVGTFIVREPVSEPVLRRALERELPFSCAMMFCPAAEILRLAEADPFASYPSSSHLTRFVSIAGRRLTPPSILPVIFPADGDWPVKVIAVQGRFLLGLYQRQMKAISYLGRLEKHLGVPVTTRNWNTIEKIVSVLKQK